MPLTLKYDFATDQSLVADIGPTLGITRASEGSYFDSSMVMQSAASGVPRFTHKYVAADAGGYPDIFAVGDSIMQSTYLGHDDALDLLTNVGTVRNLAVPNDDLVTNIEPTFAADIGWNREQITIIQGGVNDAVSQTLADTKTALTSCVTLAKERDREVFVMGIMPWAASASWTAARQTFTDDYNTWLASEASVQGFTYIDMYTDMEDTVNPDELRAAYDDGSGIHPNLAGSTAMAAIIQAALDPYLINAPAVSQSIESLGLLIEPAKTNTLIYTEDISNAAWTKNGCTIDSNASVAPDGTTTMDRVNVSTAAINHRFYDIAPAITTNAIVTLSCFVKDDGARYVGLDYLGAVGTYVVAVFDLTDEKVTSVQYLGAGANYYDSGIEPVNSDTYRIWLTASFPQTAPICVFQTHSTDVPTLQSSGQEQYTGTEGNDVFVWGMSLELGALTSYIPNLTTGSTTRNADDLTTTTLSWLDAAATAEGSWYIKGQFLAADTAARALLTLDDGTVTDRFYFERDADENINFAITNSADTDGASDGSAIIGENTAFQVAAAYADDDVIAYVDGVSSGADATVGLPLTDNPTTLRIGADSSGNYWNGTIAEIRYYNERLDNATLEDTSNGIFPAEGGGGGAPRSLGFGMGIQQ